MMMFLLGVLITWIVLSFIYVICDNWNNQNVSDSIVGLPFYLISYVFDFIVDTYKIITVLDLCIIYHIPIFRPLTLTEIKEKLDDKGKEKWVKRMPKSQQEQWKKVLDI